MREDETLTGRRWERHRQMQAAESAKELAGIANVKGPRAFPITVSVFTSGGCVFCKEALAMVRQVSKNLFYDELGVQIVELPVDEKPDLVKSLDIFAVPTIQIGRSRVVGLPRIEELENLMHEAVLTPNGV
jgi:glutaredoxin